MANCEKVKRNGYIILKLRLFCVPCNLLSMQFSLPTNTDCKILQCRVDEHENSTKHKISVSNLSMMVVTARPINSTLVLQVVKILDRCSIVHS